MISVFIPLGVLIILGYVLGRTMQMDLKTVASMAIFGFTPLVGFGAAAQLDITPGLLVLPLLTFICAAFVGLTAFWGGRKIIGDKSSYLLPVAAGSGNTGYFGLPLAISLLGNDAAGVYLLANLGVVIFESTLGYYYVVRGNLTARDAFLRVLKLPLLYALAAGLFVASIDIPLPASVLKLWELAKGGYVCVGMMIIGVALSRAQTLVIPPRLLSVALGGKFLLWPLVALLVVQADTQLTGWLTATIHDCILILSVAPMAANLAAYAAQNDLNAGQAASLILISTILAVCGLPFVLPLLL